jgi:type IV pilus assembly protein PilA
MGFRRAAAGEDGFTLMELLIVLGVVAVLMAIAVPLFVGQQNSARDAAAKSELRGVLMPLRTHLSDDPDVVDPAPGVVRLAPSAKFDGAAVLGVKLERAVDGSTCLWRTSDSGSVFGMWEPAPGQFGQTLYVERAAVPAVCPGAADAGAFGFVAGGW